jgi:hypothetical protein
MHAIGDGIDLVSREHQPRDFTMSFGYVTESESGTGVQTEPYFWR